ncbi:MAG: hypothetical protein Q9208_004610 [Pyrenodesmia sp. 3 TL-2023]
MESNGYLASALRDTGHLVEAETLGRRVLEYSYPSLGSHHRISRMAMSDLIVTFRRMGKMKEVEKWNRMRAFNSRIAPTAFGTNCGSMASFQDFLLDAEQMLCGKLQEQIEHEHPDNLLHLDLLAECLELQEKRGAAEKYRRKSLELFEHTEGKASLESIAFHRKLAVNLYGQGKSEAALLHLQNVLERLEGVHPKDTAEIQELEEFYHQYTILAIPGQSDKKDVEETTPAQDALRTPSADNERSSSSMAPSAEVQGK